MSIPAAITLVDAASRVWASAAVQGTISAGAKAIKFKNRASKIGGPITSLTSQTTVVSRVFIDESVIDEPVVANLMKTIHEWYSAQIVAALHLSRMVDSFRTIQDVMAPIQSGHAGYTGSVVGNIHSRLKGLESFGVEVASDTFDSLGLEAYYYGPINQPKEATGDPKDWKKFNKQQAKGFKAIADAQAAEDKESARNESTYNVRTVKVGDNKIGPMGELYEIKLAHPKDPSVQITVPFFVQMQPSIVPAQVAPRFIDMNVAPSLWQRWTQMTSGEISFWRDFVGQVDLIKRGVSISKDPELSSAFSDFLSTTGKKDHYAIGDISAKTGSATSSNLANSVMVFSEDTVAIAKAESGIDLHKDSDRARYFRDTYTMIVIIVDQVHQRVTVYFNGIDGELNVPYSDFKPKDSKFNPDEFMTALTAFGTNQIGRMR